MFFRCEIALLLILFVFTGGAYSQSDEAIIREIFEKTTGNTTFSLIVTPIKEGLTNRNYKVLMNGAPFFVRLGHKDPKSLRIDRVKERSLYSLAEKAGIAPPLLYSDTAAGNLVAPFIQGTAYGKKGGNWLYERTVSIQRIAALLRRYHANEAPQVLIPENSYHPDASKPRDSIDRKLGQYSNISQFAIVESRELSRGQGDRNFRELALEAKIDYPFQIIDDYIQEARALSIPLPKDMEHALEIVRVLKRHIPQQKKVLCHQDLVPDNFIFDGVTLYLVDWEYAEWSNPYYDLAALCIEHGFDEEEKQMLLNHYFRRTTCFGISLEEHRIVLEMMCMLYSMRDCLWYILENRRSPHEGCDFVRLANEHYQNFFSSARWLEAHRICLK